MRRRYAAYFYLGLLTTFIAGTGARSIGAAESVPDKAGASESFSRGYWTNNDVFPIAVWLQNPKNAQRYKAAGINTYVGLWRGPTAEQLQDLKAAGMHLICSQNTVALENRENPLIVAWMHGDEPDNAQALRTGKGYGPPIKPELIQADYQRIKEKDPSRPVLLNLGQGVAWDNYIGRGVRRNHPEDYREYLKGCDIASYDIYPAVHDNAEIAGKLEFVPQGVDRLRDWSDGRKVVWNCIECSRIGNAEVKPTPEQIRAEVWMSIIHGSRGLIYFVHQFKPTFKEASVLEDPDLLKAMTDLNAEVQGLAAVINSPQAAITPKTTTAPDVPVDTLFRKFRGSNYLFAANMRNQKTHATFDAEEVGKEVEVLGENRTVSGKESRFGDEFSPYAVHLYRWRSSGSQAPR